MPPDLAPAPGAGAVRPVPRVADDRPWIGNFRVPGRARAHARRICSKPAPTRTAVRAGCTCGAAARLRSLKAAGAARPIARGRASRRPWRRELDGRAGAASRAIGIAFRWVWLCWSRAGSRRRSCAAALEAQQAAGQRTAGPVAGAAAGRQRGAGHAGPGAAVELSGAAPGISRSGSADRCCCRGSSSTPSARCPCAWPPDRFSISALRTRLDPALALAVERMTGLRVESGLVQGSHFRPAHTRACSESRFPPWS